MAVRFILGRSGTGKTSYCIDAIVDELLRDSDRPLLLLVPEQATYQAERSVLAHDDVSGYHRLHVLSFDRLQFMLLGKNTATPTLSRIGRQMLVHRILRDRKDELSIFGSSASSPGLAGRVAQTIAELHDYAQSPEAVEGLLAQIRKDKPHSLTALKLADIHLVFAEYLKCIEGRFLDPDVQLARACAAVPSAGLVRGAMLWVDGFAGFTEAEFAVLTEMLKVVEDAYIALCLDPSRSVTTQGNPGEPDPADMFYPTQRTYAALLQRIRECKLQMDEPIVFDEPIRFGDSAALGQVERYLFEPKPGRTTAGDDIRIVCAPNERAEVQLVAREVIRLVREAGLRYRDMAVIASDISRYQHYIEACFNDYGLPFFIDRRKPLSRHPLVELICSALHIASAGFSHSEIFAYLKTDLVAIDRSDVDMLENYCLAFGVQGGEWQSAKPWRLADPKRSDYDEKRVNKIRAEVTGPLMALRDRLAGGGDSARLLGAREFTQAVFDFLDAIDVGRTLSRWIAQAAADMDQASVDEHQQFYTRLIDVFDELAEVFGDVEMPVEDYLSILRSAFSQMTLAFIPPTLDQVLVGSIERSRHPDLKAVFLVGTTQKQFPVTLASDSILNDNDRRVAESMSFQLAPSMTQSLADRRYLAYIAFTRPSQYLYISYPAVNEKGSAEQPSQFIGDLMALFTDLEEQSAAYAEGNFEDIYTQAELRDILSATLGKDNLAADEELQKVAGHILDCLATDSKLTSLGEAVVSSLEYENQAELDESLLPALFGERLETSATRLGMFAACPYQYFVRYVLKLDKREEFKLEPLDLGSFYHRVLDCLLKAVARRGDDFATIDEQVLFDVLEEQIQQIRSEDTFISSFARRSPHNTFIIDSAAEFLHDCVRDVAEMIRAGSFRPAMSEVAFGTAKDVEHNIGKFQVTLPDGRTVWLNGKIDRVDVAEIDGQKYAVVFDYKMRSRSFSWARFAHGLDMQLPIYMLAVRDSGAAAPVGAFYVPIETSPGPVAIDEMEKQCSKFNRKSKGMLNGEHFDKLDGQVSSGWSRFYNFSLTKDDGQYGRYDQSGALRPGEFESALRFAELSIVRITTDILSGQIDITPSRLNRQSPCTYCDYRSVCRFDWQINDYSTLPALSKKEVLARMEASDAG